MDKIQKLFNKKLNENIVKITKQFDEFFEKCAEYEVSKKILYGLRNGKILIA